MEVDRLLSEWARQLASQGQVVHVERLPAKPAAYAEPQQPIPGPVLEMLARAGIERLYTHQARALDILRSGKSVVVVSGTASGKSMCYNIAVLERLLRDEQPPAPQDRFQPSQSRYLSGRSRLGDGAATALYIFPTKALSQDQLRLLQELCPGVEQVRPAIYDGDTPPSARRQARQRANIVLTNPDMLHTGILPHHALWHKFFSGLAVVVLDEIHTYRGVFGSHVANVLRRLRRVANHYGSDPQFVCCSATIANGRELAEQLTGVECEIVQENGAPKGPKTFLLWNPPAQDSAGLMRRSAHEEASAILSELVSRRIQTIAFTRTRLAAELLRRYTCETVSDPSLLSRIGAYRAGYLPEERRQIERGLSQGELLAVASTNALELGIDIGGLDACVILGYPGTIASTWQQAGRAGRGTEPSLVILVAYSNPLDQYLMRHPDYFFDASPEHAALNPQNPYILASHLRCAAFELPLQEQDAQLFGELLPEIGEALEQGRALKRIEGAWYWSSEEFPAAQVSLRTVSDNTFTIVDRSEEGRVVGMVDAISAPELVYPGGVYLHQDRTYLVRELDLEGRVAYIEPAQVDYYTQALLDAQVRVLETLQQRQASMASFCFGRVEVIWRTVGFKKIRFGTMESIGYGSVSLPSQSFQTEAMWIMPGPELGQRKKLHEGLAGIRNVAVLVLPLFAMCDRQDLGGLVDSRNTGAPAIFLYDRYPGGLGLAETGYSLAEKVLTKCLELIQECPCENGCPSCVGAPVTRPPQHSDPDLFSGRTIPDKAAALALLRELAGCSPAAQARLDPASPAERRKIGRVGL
jgi:DEAD/DEAH box helicase domain-containing protein